METNRYKEPDYREFLRWALWLVGPIRGGYNGDCGSIVWADSSEWAGEENFFGKEISQIVGHNKLCSGKFLSKGVELTEGVFCVDTISPNVLFW